MHFRNNVTFDMSLRQVVYKKLDRIWDMGYYLLLFCLIIFGMDASFRLVEVIFHVIC